MLDRFHCRYSNIYEEHCKLLTSMSAIEKLDVSFERSPDSIKDRMNIPELRAETQLTASLQENAVRILGELFDDLISINDTRKVRIYVCACFLLCIMIYYCSDEVRRDV